MTEAVCSGLRVLALEGGHNFREVGGYPAALGTRLRRGRLWRSAALDRLWPQDCAAVLALDLRTIADLRTETERARFPSAPSVAAGALTLAWPSGGPAHGWSQPTSAAWQDLTADGVRAELGRLYVRIADAHVDPLRDIACRLADGGAPLLVHCTAGKDRTGIVVAVLLELLGVSREWILWDYEQTARHLNRDLVNMESVRAVGGPALGFDALSAEVQDLILGVDRSYLATVLASLDARFGSAEGLAQKWLSLPERTLAQLRVQLLEPT
jgi:protein-tyrosine phosphatase